MMLTEAGEHLMALRRHDVGCHSRTLGAVDLPLGGVGRFISFFSAIGGGGWRAMVGQRAARTGGRADWCSSGGRRSTGAGSGGHARGGRRVARVVEVFCDTELSRRVEMTRG
jgi:hypothetical protein